jgi:hypothetical protein
MLFRHKREMSLIIYGSKDELGGYSANRYKADTEIQVLLNTVYK